MHQLTLFLIEIKKGSEWIYFKNNRRTILQPLCFFSWSACFSWSYPATKHGSYFFFEAWVAKDKISIGGLTNLVNNSRLQLMTEQFPVGGLPFFTGSAKTQVDEKRGLSPIVPGPISGARSDPLIGPLQQLAEYSL